VGIVVDTKKGESIFPEWVWKSDCGTESNTEAQKGEASDSFKRACFNWGIGRELYTAPFIWVGVDKCNIKNGKCYDTFEVTSVTIENKKITALEVYNKSKKCIAFTFGKKTAPKIPEETPKETPKETTEGFVCAKCGVPIDESMAMRTFKAFGVTLCRECGIKRSEMK
jgi:hypothetical protein